MLIPVRLIVDSVDMMPSAVRFQDDVQKEFQVEITYDFYKTLIKDKDDSDFALEPAEESLPVSKTILGAKNDGTSFIPEDKGKFCETFRFNSKKYGAMLYVLYFADEENQKIWYDHLGWHNYVIYKMLFPLLCCETVGGVACQIAFNDDGDRILNFTSSIVSRYSVNKCKQIFEMIHFDVIDEIVIGFKDNHKPYAEMEITTNIPFGDNRYSKEEMMKDFFKSFQAGDKIVTTSSDEGTAVLAVPIKGEDTRKATYLKLYIDQLEPPVGWEKMSNEIIEKISETIIDEFCDTSTPLAFYYLGSRKATVKYVFASYKSIDLKEDFKDFLRKMVADQIFEEFRSDSEMNKKLLDGPNPLGVLDVQIYQEVDDMLTVEVNFVTH